MSRLRNFFGWSAAAASVAAVSLELTVRIDDWAQFGVPLFAPAVEMSELAVRDSSGFHARPGAHFRQYRINRLGFRGDEPPRRVDGATVVFTAGASETFGLYESPGREWPRQLQDSLASCQPKVRVWNAAFAGMALPTVQQDFERRLRPYAARLLLYYPTPMQYLTTPLPTPAPPVAGPVAPLPAFRSRALPRFRDAIKRSVPERLLDVARSVMTARSRSAQGIVVSTVVDTARLNAFERDLRAFVGQVRAAGVSPVLVVHANRFTDTTSTEAQRLLAAWERFYPEYTGTAIVRFDAAAALRTMAIARDSGIVVVDPRERLRQVGAGVFNDFSHFNDAGAAIVAGATARAIAPLLCSEGGPAVSVATPHH